MAAATLFASVPALAGALTDQYGKLAPEVEPSEPPLSGELVHEKPVSEFPSVMLLPPVPGVLAVTVTVPLVPPLAIADTPEIVGQALIATAKCAAWSEIEPLPTLNFAVKFGAVPVHESEPLSPVVFVSQEKL